MESTMSEIEDIRLERIRAGATKADEALAAWILAEPERANSAGIVVIFATSMIRAAQQEPAAMLDKLYTFSTLLDALVEYVETGETTYTENPFDALAELAS
jgi:hypothetical protein